MAFWQTNTGFQVWMGNKPFSTWFNAGFSSPLPTNTWWNTVKTTQRKDTYTYNPRYPWFDEEDYKKLEQMVASKGLTGSKKTEVMDQLYEIYYPQVLNKHKLDERQQEINNSVHENGELLLNGNEEASMWLKLTSLSQQAKQKFWIPYDTPDNEVIDAMVKWIPNWSQLLYDYVNGKNQDLLYEAGLKEKQEETWWQKAADFGVWVLQSPWKRWYNMVWQWADKWAKEIKDATEWTTFWDWMSKQATDLVRWSLKKAWYSDEEIDREINAYVQERDKALEDWTAFNGREATDIRTSLLWEERANNWWTKAWEVVGDIGSAIAMSAPLSAALAPAMAWWTLWEAALLWAIEWGIDTLATQYGTQWNLDITPTQAILWIAGGAWGWMLTNKLSQVANNVDDVANNVDDATKNAKITTKIADKTDDAKKVAGRIWQWDIDDQAKVVEWVKSITKRSGEKWITDIKKYSELKDSIKATEKQIINQEDDLLRQFPDKITDRTTTETVKWLGDQVDDVTRDYLDDWIELLKKYNKNDPVAMKELEMLQNTKNTEWLTRLEAKELARKLWAKLSKKFYNSNDELRNSMSAESYEQIRKWIQNAVRYRLPDDVLKNLDLEYSNLKAFEWLTDDMAEKVNTLTQKLKEVWPIEKLWKKVGDAINRVTGKGIKWLVEKFLPSNMWNKINNSIDMELELSKNLSKLVDLNKAIDTLNTTLNNPASKSAINTALRNFANSISELQINLTPAITSTTTIGYNTLEK